MALSSREVMSGGAASDIGYRRGAVMGLTVAEAFILLAFCLLLLFSWWQIEADEKTREAEIAREDGSLDLARQIKDAGLHPASAAAMAELKEHVGLLAEEGVPNLVRGLKDLAPETRQGLAEAVEAGASARLIEVEQAMADGSLDLAREISEAGLLPTSPMAMADLKNHVRFLSEDDVRRLMRGLVELPPETRLKLADTVEVGSAAKLIQAMTDMLPEEPIPDDPVAQISQRLASAAEAERRLVAALEGRLGEAVRGAGGEIDADGTISLPQQVLFEVNEDQVRDPEFLRAFCGPWLDTLRGAGLDLSELKIEGHASSEGPPGSTPSAAWLYNLDLSQRRAQNTLTTCLDSAPDTASRDWAREHLVAVGYSSTRLVQSPGGDEDRERSRRVMFSVAVDREQLLEEIGRDLEAGAPAAGSL